MERIIEVKNLRKNYGEIKAVQGIDFYVEKGKLFAFLGPNGAGKSTTIDMLCTLLKPDDGEIIIDGYAVGEEDHKIRDQIGVVFQDSILDDLLTVRENLMVRGSFYSLGGKKLKEAVDRAAMAAGVLEFFDRPYGKLSGGQRRRADIARALINTPKVLFLDEPTTGLDPQTKESVWRTITELQEKHDMTVFLTTHYMEEAAEADYIIIIDYGKIAAKGTPYELMEKYSSDLIKIKTSHKEEVIELLKSKKVTFYEKGELIIGELKSSKGAIEILSKGDSIIDSFEVVHGTMKDVFINITGREMREDA